MGALRLSEDRRLFAGAALALLGLLFVPSVQAQDQSPVDICYATQFDRESGPIKEITATVTRSDSAEENSYGLSLSFTEWDVPNELFSTFAGCMLEGGLLKCSIDCDGGRATAVVDTDGRMLLQADGLAFGSSGYDTPLAVTDADGGQLNGIYALTRREAEGGCGAAPDEKIATLEPGDISSRVEAAERILNKAGQLLEFPDAVFDDRTAAAVRAFQHQYGIAETGRIDQTTELLLARASAGMGGGC